MAMVPMPTAWVPRARALRKPAHQTRPRPRGRPGRPPLELTPPGANQGVQGRNPEVVGQGNRRIAGAALAAVDTGVETDNIVRQKVVGTHHEGNRDAGTVFPR